MRRARKGHIVTQTGGHSIGPVDAGAPFVVATATIPNFIGRHRRPQGIRPGCGHPNLTNTRVGAVGRPGRRYKFQLVPRGLAHPRQRLRPQRGRRTLGHRQGTGDRAQIVGIHGHGHRGAGLRNFPNTQNHLPTTYGNPGGGALEARILVDTGRSAVMSSG